MDSTFTRFGHWCFASLTHAGEIASQPNRGSPFAVRLTT